MTDTSKEAAESRASQLEDEAGDMAKRNPMKSALYQDAALLRALAAKLAEAEARAESARADALRESADRSTEIMYDEIEPACNSGPIKAVHEAILALLDQPQPAPTPDRDRAP